MVQGGMSVVKCLLFVFNFIFVVCGIALIVVGAIAQSTGKQYTDFLGAKFVTAPIILIVMGCAIFIIAFFGCWGAMKQNYCMVMTFGILLMLIFIIEIAGGIVAYVYRGELDNIVTENMKNTIKQDKEDSNKIWEEMQIKWECCGVYNSSDYTNIGRKIPQSCCPQNETETICTTQAFKMGCHEKLVDLIKDKITIVGGAGIGIAFVEILGMIFAWCLASAIRKEYEGV